MYNSAESLRVLGVLLFPFMPKSCESLMLQLGVEKSIEEQGMRSLDNWGSLSPGTKTQKAKQLFPRIEDKQAAKILAELETQKSAKKMIQEKLPSMNLWKSICVRVKSWKQKK